MGKIMGDSKITPMTPLDSASKSKTRTMEGGKGKGDVKYKGSITSYQGEPLGSATDCKK